MVYVLDAHLCLNNPPQRGGVPLDDLTTQGLTLCRNTLGPCGTLFPNISTSEKTYVAGSNVTVEIILNLQHRLATDPGNISMSYCTNGVCQSNSDFTNIAGASIPDPANVTIPDSLTIPTQLPSNLPAGILVLRATYITNEETIYYMCSDVTIQSNSTNSTSFLNMKLGGVIEVLYVIIGGGGLLIVIVIIIVVVICVKKRRASNDDDYYGSSVATRKDEPSKAIPMMSMNDIQNNLMRTAQDDDQGYDTGNGNGNGNGYGNDNRGGGYANTSDRGYNTGNRY